jgi:hypothetical protein
MSSGMQPSGSDDRPLREPDQAEPRNVNQELLEQVLQATLSLGADDPPGPEELRTLTAVAKRRGDDPLSVELVTELVQTVLQMRFRSLADSRSQWERMTQRIAETMFDDPPTRQRIESLWTLLRESAS